MTDLLRLVHRLIIRLQLRSLEQQAQSIVAAREHAYARLLEIERECCRKKEALWRSDAPVLRVVR